MKNGKYILIVAPNDYPGKKYRGRYAYEHIVNFWKKEGRLPLEGCVVHHVDEDKHNNNFVNLVEVLNKEHTSEHSKKEIRHGFSVGYRRGCRCEQCREAQRVSMQQYRLNKKPS